MSKHMIDRLRLVPLASVACAAALVVLAGGCAQKPKPGTYATPEEAVAAAAALVGTNNDPRTDEVFGPGSSEAFHTGDAAVVNRQYVQNAPSRLMSMTPMTFAATASVPRTRSVTHSQ